MTLEVSMKLNNKDVSVFVTILKKKINETKEHLLSKRKQHRNTEEKNIFIHQIATYS